MTQYLICYNYLVSRFLSDCRGDMKLAGVKLMTGVSDPLEHEHGL